MTVFTFPIKQNVHFALTPDETDKLIDCLLTIAGDDDGITPDPAFADDLATRLCREMRELGLPFH